MITMGQWNPGIGRYGERRAHAGNDFERNTGVDEGFRFLATAAKDKGSPPLSRTTSQPCSA